ncbi:hypothetical protein OJ253_2326 [Cryptosporidium canis]|uniref:LsmAD domain-containing protein n=1 Tax=Cryptosporidium canis TaxID=195482 RepID=A0A9D5HWS2_9CRYT|nr:hypothetical protein OJ253_2326 [Cryptosporidium canis]
MEPSDSDPRILKSNSKNSKFISGRNQNTTRGSNQQMSKRKHKQFQKVYEDNHYDARNCSISERITTTETLSNSSPEFAVLMLVLIGNEVELMLADSQVYRGIFHSISTKGGTEQFVCIRFCRKITSLFSKELSKPIEDYHLFPLSSIYRISTVNINGIPTSFDSVSGELKGSYAERINTFMTDNEISHNNTHLHERALKPWISEDQSSNIVEEVLGNESIDCWDQFEENRAKFGVQGAFDENLYTTPLDYNAVTEEEKRNAELLADEIEKEQKTSSVNYIEHQENDLIVENDEEMNFSSVYRSVPIRIGSSTATCSRLENESIKISETSTANDTCEINSSELPKDSDHKSKSNFSFNPNAKEFLPRAIPNLQTMQGNSLSGYNDQIQESVDFPYEFQSQYHNSYEHNQFPGAYPYNFEVHQPGNVNSGIIQIHSTQLNGIEFDTELNSDCCDEANPCQIQSGGYYLPNHDETDASANIGYKYQDNSYDVQNTRAIYYYQESEDVQNSGYYVTDYEMSKWPNYQMNGPCYIPNNNSEQYSGYCNNSSQGTHY